MKSILIKTKDDSLHKRIKIAAIENGITMQALIESSINIGLRSFEPVQIQEEAHRSGHE